MGRKVAIVGTAPSGKDAPFGDPSWEVWGVSARADYFTRATRWYELHRLDGEVVQWAAEWRQQFKQWAQRFPDQEMPPLFMFFPEPGLLPDVRAFDPKPLIAKFGSFFFTSTIAWEIGQALYEHLNGETVDRIGLWGTDMEYSTEYREQRAGVQHFLLLAKAIGVDVEIVKSSGLTYEPIPYPFWMDDPLLAKVALRLRDAERKHREILELLRDGERRQNERRGRVKLIKEQVAVIEGGSEEAAKQIRETENEIASVEDGLNQMRVDAGGIEGMKRELEWLDNYLKQ